MTETSAPTTDELTERIFGALLGTVDILAVFLGDRLGWYRSLVDDGPATPVQLAQRTGTHPRYAREWLEQQAVTGLLALDRLDDDPDARVYSIPSSTIWRIPVTACCSSHSRAYRASVPVRSASSPGVAGESLRAR